MANHASSKKRIRQTKRRAEVNSRRLSHVRTCLKKVEEAIVGGDQGKARDALRAAQPVMMRGAQKSVIHRNTAARRLSRLSRRIKAMAA